jgi:hypothetical protein
MTENFTRKDIREALHPIASIIIKSEKAQTKLTHGTWQHTMLSNNLKALGIASTLMDGENRDTNDCVPDDLRKAVSAFESMINRTANTKNSCREHHSIRFKKTDSVRCG